MGLRYAIHRVDANQPDIVDGLRDRGFIVTAISGGRGRPDILVRRDSWPAGLSYGFEIKTHTGKRRASQEATNWPIVRSVEDALKTIGVIR